MTAPSPFCSDHGRGTANPCGHCRDARLRNALWRVQHGDLSGPVHPRRVTASEAMDEVRRNYRLRTRNAVPSGESLGVELEAVLTDNDDRTVGGDEKLRGASVFEEDRKPGTVPVVPGVGQVVLDLVRPVVVVVRRRQVKNGSVVVQLDSHGRKRIARRILVAAAVAAVSLWAVAS